MKKIFSFDAETNGGKTALRLRVSLIEGGHLLKAYAEKFIFDKSIGEYKPVGYCINLPIEVSADNEKYKDAMKRLGIKPVEFGRSGFKSRRTLTYMCPRFNTYTPARINNADYDYIIISVEASWKVTPENFIEEIRKTDNLISISDRGYILKIPGLTKAVEELYDGEEEIHILFNKDEVNFLTNVDENKIIIINENIKKELEKIKLEKYQDLIESLGDINFVEIGGDRNNYQRSDLLNAGYNILWERRVAATKDHRLNRTHTYLVLAAKKSVDFNGKPVVLEFQEKYSDLKGLFIGKKGWNIKNLAEKINAKYIKIK